MAQLGPVFGATHVPGNEGIVHGGIYSVREGQTESGQPILSGKVTESALGALLPEAELGLWVMGERGLARAFVGALKRIQQGDRRSIDRGTGRRRHKIPRNASMGRRERKDHVSQSQGFLSADLSVSIANIRRDFEPWFAVAEGFNALAMRVLPDVKAATNNNQQVVAAALYGRALTSFQASLILAERGLIADARTVVRAAAETAIVLSAVAKDAAVCDLLIDRHVWHHVKIRKAWLRDPQATAHMTPEEAAAVKETISDVEAQFPQSKTLTRDPVAVAALADKAGVAALYNTVYRSTSGDAAHTSLDALNRHIRVDANGDISGMKFGPSGDDLPATLSDAISVLGFALHAVADLFQIPELINDLAACVADWKALGAPSDYKPKQA